MTKFFAAEGKTTGAAMTKFFDAEERLRKIEPFNNNWHMDTDEEGREWIKIPNHDLLLGEIEDMDGCCYDIAKFIINAPRDLALLLKEVKRLQTILQKEAEVVQTSVDLIIGDKKDD